MVKNGKYLKIVDSFGTGSLVGPEVERRRPVVGSSLRTSALPSLAALPHSNTAEFGACEACSVTGYLANAENKML